LTTTNIHYYKVSFYIHIRNKAVTPTWQDCTAHEQLDPIKSISRAILHDIVRKKRYEIPTTRIGRETAIDRELGGSCMLA
jgi:hypothetical protein